MTEFAMLVVTADGQVRDHTVATKDTPDATSRAVLHALYQQIACDTVDVVRLIPDINRWVDDVGLLAGRPLNPTAGYVATRLGYDYQQFAGTAVFTGGPGLHGYTESLSPAARDLRHQLIAETPHG